MIKFKHPADAMRARIEGKLYCGECKHIAAKARPYSRGWCTKKKIDPCVGKPFEETICPEFKQHIRPHD